MKIIYEPSILDQIAKAKEEALRVGKEIKKILLTGKEMERLLTELWPNGSPWAGRGEIQVLGVRVEISREETA